MYTVTLTQAEIETIDGALSNERSQVAKEIRWTLNTTLRCESIGFGQCRNKRYEMTRFCVEHQAEAESEAA